MFFEMRSVDTEKELTDAADGDSGKAHARIQIQPHIEGLLKVEDAP